MWNKQAIYLPLITFYNTLKLKSSFKLLLLMTKGPRAVFQQVEMQNYSVSFLCTNDMLSAYWKITFKS